MQKVRILIVEDDLQLRETLEEVLTDEGYQVSVALRGEDAVTLASQQLFDLVVTDIKMPGMDGLEALEQVKQRHPEVKSLVVTGYSSHADAVRAVRLGVGDYLQKPFGLEALLGRIREMVSERQSELAEKSRREAFLSATLTSLELGASLLSPKLKEAAKRAAELSGVARATLSQVTTLALGCRELGPVEECRDFGAYLEPFLLAAKEFWDGSGPEGLSGTEIPFESRVAALALFVSLENDKALPQGRFDPELVEHFEKPQKNAPLSTADQRSLLTLGQAFERGGDLENAFLAYDSLLSASKPSLTVFEAALGKARLERAVGGEQLESLLQTLQQLSQSLGPVCQARAALEAGFLLLPKLAAQSYLHRAKALAADLGDDLAQAKADLGLASTGLETSFRGALEQLMLPENVWELCDSATWLLPWLLENPSVVKPAAIVAILGEAPQAFQRLIESDLLSLRAKLAAIDALRQEEGTPARAAIHVLSQDPEPQVQKALSSLLQDQKLGQFTPSLRLTSFGPFTVSRGDEQIPENAWKHQKIKYLMAYLAQNWKNPVSDEQLMEEFWPGPADRAKRSLYQATYHLRRVLKISDSSSVDYVLRERGCLSLNSKAPIWNDYRELEEALDAGNLPSNRAVLSRALSLYRGPYLERCYMDWAVSARGSLEIRVQQARAWLAQDSLRNKNGNDALQQAQHLFEMDPLNQEGQLYTMQALLMLGQSQAALNHFETCAGLLLRELNLEPSIEMLELQQRAKFGGEPQVLIG